MYKYIVFAFVGLLVLQGATAKPKAKQSQLQERTNAAQNAVDSLANTLEGNLPDSKKVVEALNTHAQKLADNFQTVVDKIKTELKSHEGDLDGVLKTISENLSQGKANIEKALGTDGQKKAKEIKEDFDKVLKNAVTQVDKLREVIEPEANKIKTDLTNAATTFLDQIVDASKKLREEVKAANQEQTRKQ